jgi:putative hemolysin
MDPNPAGSILAPIALVLFLIFLGSLFVAAEIALISLRESQVRQVALRGRRGAKVAKLHANPNRLLAAVQVGVTLSGFLSAALGAEKLGQFVIPWLEERGLSNKSANTMSLIGLTLIIAYISLVFG